MASSDGESSRCRSRVPRQAGKWCLRPHDGAGDTTAAGLGCHWQQRAAPGRPASILSLAAPRSACHNGSDRGDGPALAPSPASRHILPSMTATGSVSGGPLGRLGQEAFSAWRWIRVGGADCLDGIPGGTAHLPLAVLTQASRPLLSIPITPPTSAAAARVGRSPRCRCRAQARLAAPTSAVIPSKPENWIN